MTTGSRLSIWIARVFGILCTVVWIAAFIATHLPAEKLPRTAVSDKVLHFVCYFVIASLFLLTLAGLDLKRARRVAIVFCVVILYGAFDEITQMFVNRTASVLDWTADSLGVIAALLAVELVLALAAKRRTG